MNLKNYIRARYKQMSHLKVNYLIKYGVAQTHLSAFIVKIIRNKIKVQWKMYKNVLFRTRNKLNVFIVSQQNNN